MPRSTDDEYDGLGLAPTSPGGLRADRSSGVPEGDRGFANRPDDDEDNFEDGDDDDEDVDDDIDDADELSEPD